MAKESFSPEYDQHDPKVFKETLGSFGTTTTPGQNQLQELAQKVRQGVKHVELHLASTGKGQFGVQDVPDKYGFEQRRTIMQLAKLNQQTLSVHANFETTSFSGLGQGGFDDAARLNAMKEIDETLKFAAETAKQGAVVFHIQGEPLSTDRGELNLSKDYIQWLEKNRPDEYKRIKEKYFTANPLDREFVSDPDKEKEIKKEFGELKEKDPQTYNKYISQFGSADKAWVGFYQDKVEEKRKLSPDMQPLVVIGDKLGQTQRSQDIVNIDTFKENNFTSKEREMLNALQIDSQYFDISTVQRAQAFFANEIPRELRGKFSEDDFNRLKSKVLITYEDILKDNNYLQAQADEAFHKKLLDFQIQSFKLQEQDLDQNYNIHEDHLKDIKNLEREEKDLYNQIIKAKQQGDKKKVRELKVRLNGGLNESEESEMNSLQQRAKELQEKAQNITQDSPEMRQIYSEFQDVNSKIERLGQKAQHSGIQLEKHMLMSRVGQIEYQKLERYDEMKSQISEKIKELSNQKKDVKAVTDVSFEKNTSAIGHLGMKALRYQLDLKKKSKDAQAKLSDINSQIRKLEEEYENASQLDKNKLHVQIQKKKYELRNWIGVKDYEDIDLVSKPLYLAPENMLPGYGSLTSLEEFKGAIRMSQEDFAQKILSNESEYKKLREEYENETGIKVKSHADAIELAKRHIGGTFDNAHAAVWLKHFKREEGESDEHRIERFNKWLNQQAEDMAKEGIIKHVHFNDTQAKDDDHNLLGQGILDLHDMRERLRKAGIKEPLIVEAGGRSGQAGGVRHMLNAFEIFNPTLQTDGYRAAAPTTSSGVSDWVSVQRDYLRRPQYSSYSMGDSTFRHQPPPQGMPRGDWSGTGFL